MCKRNFHCVHHRKIGGFQKCQSLEFQLLQKVSKNQLILTLTGAKHASLLCQAQTACLLSSCVMLCPHYSCSCSCSRLVRMCTGSRVPIQPAQATRATGSCGSGCCRYIKARLASLWRTEISAAQMTRSADSVNMEWTNDATVQLISEYQKHVVL